MSGGGRLQTAERPLERMAGVRAPCTSAGDRCPGYSSGVTSGVDAWRSWAGRRVVLVDAHLDRQWTRQARPPERSLEGALRRSSMDGCGHDCPWTPVAVMDVAVRRGVRSGHHRPDARPHHGSVAHRGNRGRPARRRQRTRAWKARPPARSAGTLHAWRWSGAPATDRCRPGRNRQLPVLRACRGTAGEDEPAIGGRRWPQLGRR
jgi:hypothetical protein